MIVQFIKKEDSEHQQMINRMILLTEKWAYCSKHELMLDINTIKYGMERFKDKFENAGYKNNEFMLEVAQQAFATRFMHRGRTDKVA